MYYRLFHLLILSGVCFMSTSEWNIFLNLDDDDKLLCYSCKDSGCTDATDNEQKKVLCNKNTQLCWAGYVNERPYRTCANRYCTPNDFSMDNAVRIETCCRTDLCNSIALPVSAIGRSYPPLALSSSTGTYITTRAPSIRTTTEYNTTTAATPDYFIDEIADEPTPSLLVDESDSDKEETVAVYKPPTNANVHWRHLSNDKDFNNGVASISSFVLFLIPLLFVLLF